MTATMQILGSRHFAPWLTQQNISLAFSTYQSGKLFLIGRNPKGELALFERTFNRCLGLWGDEQSQTLWASTAFQLWRFENILQSGDNEQGFDRLYVPMTGYTSGDIDVHDLSLIHI